MALVKLARFIRLPVGLGLLIGCANYVAAPVQVSVKGMSGSVHGGQQPVVGATIQLYTVGTTGDGSAATPLLTTPVVSGVGGNFSISGDYSCASATQVYMTATGGSPGSGVTNPNLSLIAALGPCSALSTNTFISINELTTVAATSALSGYMTSASSIGSGTGDASGLANAFTMAGAFVNTATGQAPGAGVPAGMSVPVAELNTLADVLAPCINSSGGTAGDGSLCGKLFSLTTPPSGTAPTSGVAAMLNVALNPTLNTTGLYGLVAATAPFQPVLSGAPASFAVALQQGSGAGQLVVNPLSLTFGTAAVGFSSPAQTITVSNTGTAAVGLSGLAVTGTNATEFAQTNTCGTAVAANGSCTVTVIFTPGTIGSRSATLGITTTVGTLQSVPMTGTGGVASAGPVTLSATKLSYSDAGAILDFSVYNYGSGPLTIRGITSNNTNFNLETNGCGKQVAAQSACVVSVQSTGIQNNNGQYASYSGTLTVDDDAAAGAQTVALSSYNVDEVSTNYTGLNTPGVKYAADFGTNPVGLTQSGGNARVSPYSFYSSAQLYASLSGANPGDFALASTNCLVPNGSYQNYCTIPITFTPAAIGYRSAKVLVNGGPEYMRISGTGAAPGPSLVTTYTSSTFFEGAAVRNASGVATDTDTYTLYNNGSTAVSPTFMVSGTNAANYSVASSTCASLVAGANCTFTVTFSATTVGNFSASVAIGDLHSSYSVALSTPFVTYYPQLSTSPSTLTFANPVGTTSAAQTFTVTNGNIGGYVGDPITASTPASGLYTVTPQSCPASSTSACQFSVLYSPTVASTSSTLDTVTLTDTVSGNTTKVSLYGQGTNPKVSLSPASLSFPARSVGTTSVPTTVTLTNSGTTSLTVGTLTLSGAVNGNFSQTNNCSGNTVAVGGTCTISVTFAPVAQGSQAASIVITSNAVSSPDTLSISGTAQ